MSDRSDPKPGLYDPSRRFALNLETGKEIAIPTLGEEFISYDGRLLFVAEEEGTITVSELQGGKIVGKLTGLRVLATTRDGNWAVSELPQGKMQLWDLREGQVRETSVVVSTPGKSAGPVEETYLRTSAGGRRCSLRTARHSWTLATDQSMYGTSGR